MNKPEYFEILEDHAVFRPTGQVSLEQAVDMITSALVFAREQHIKKLLAVTTGATGFKPPCLSDRYFIVRKWANAAQRKICVAVVARPEMIDFENIGVIAGQNVGLRCNVFASEEDAMVWLKSVQSTAVGDTTQFFRRRAATWRSWRKASAIQAAGQFRIKPKQGLNPPGLWHGFGLGKVMAAH